MTETDIDELVRLYEQARAAAARFGDAVKAHADNNDMDAGALRRVVKATATDTMHRVGRELRTLETLATK